MTHTPPPPVPEPSAPQPPAPQPSAPEPFTAAFTPVPRAQNRHTGWTPERQHDFIEALADLGSVRAAANRAGMTPESAYQLRRHPEAGAFRQAWEAALKHGIKRLEDIAMERALHGVEVPVYHFGQIVGTRRVYNDSLLMFLLRNRAPKRFSADSWANTDAATKGQLDRLRKKWHAEWEEHRATEGQKSSEEILQGINTKIEQMRQNRLARMSPETRALHDAYEAAREADEAREQTSWTGPGNRPAPALEPPPPPDDAGAQEPAPGPSIRPL